MKVFNSSHLNHGKVTILNAAFFILGIYVYLISLASCSTDDFPTEDEIIADIQSRLNVGETPWEIYNNREIPTSAEYFSGLNYGGGIIISFDSQDGKGLIVSSEDLEKSTWGCHGYYIQDLPVAESLFDPYDRSPMEGSRYGDGMMNTKIIAESACGENSAAKICLDYVHDGYDDWFLPSIAEMSNFSVANVHGEYWSSTVRDSASSAYFFEYHRDRAYGSTNDCFCFPGSDGPPGRTSIESRHVLKDIRAVRAF